MNQANANRVLITGANGNLGTKLLVRLAAQPLRALVRSPAARSAIETLARRHDFADLEICEVDYGDEPDMLRACSDCGYLVHLIGIIRETPTSSFQVSHVEHSQVLVSAMSHSGISRLCYLSLMGADVNSDNACLATRGQAEQLFLDSSAPALVLRIPMVLGQGDYATAALKKRAQKALSLGFRMSSLEQPIFAGDVIEAIAGDVERCSQAPLMRAALLELAGPESLPRRELVARAGRLLGTQPRVISLPIGLARFIAVLMEKSSRYPPVSRAMLGVLDHDDRIDPQPACAQLGIELTPLDEALSCCLLE